MIKKMLLKFSRLLKEISYFLDKLNNRIITYFNIKSDNSFATFKFEGDRKVKLPPISLFSVFYRDASFKNTIMFYSRSDAEPLLRKIVFDLYQKKLINPQNSLIDIGSWLGDNSLIWASMLENEGRVFSIDPSHSNLAYSRELAKMNKIENITWIEEVCAEKEGITLDYEGSIDHTSFIRGKNSKGSLISSSLDALMAKEGNPEIGLLHVDVEGFELSVLKGAKNIIKDFMPVIIYEQHISKQDSSLVSTYLKSFGYRVFMINEVLPICDLDCRNFIALNNSIDNSYIENFYESKARKHGVFSAAVGSTLIEV
mgnify:CR=1 FL=1|tara:strand:- start:6062 stop:7000 length:939 start_codon:yes stop_codon:yes gene_type:complete